MILLFFKWGIQLGNGCLTKGNVWKGIHLFWGKFKVKRLKYQSEGSEKGDTLPVFWCPSSTAPPSSWICKDKRVWTIMHLNPQNLDTEAHKCTINTHFIQYSYIISEVHWALWQHTKGSYSSHEFNRWTLASLLFRTLTIHLKTLVLCNERTGAFRT